MSDPNRDPVHDIVAQVVMRLGKEHNADPVQIRAALAMNLVNLCNVTCGDRSRALSDVQAAIDVWEGIDADRAAREKLRS